jgi:hypothetical protein
VLTHSVRNSRTSAGAERHAQSSVTSSQPDESASPMGIRQLKTQEGADWTAGRAVMVYSGEVDVSTVLEVEDCATASPTSVRRLRKFMMAVVSMTLKRA